MVQGYSWDTLGGHTELAHKHNRTEHYTHIMIVIQQWDVYELLKYWEVLGFQERTPHVFPLPLHVVVFRPRLPRFWQKPPVL